VYLQALFSGMVARNFLYTEALMADGEMSLAGKMIPRIKVIQKKNSIPSALNGYKQVLYRCKHP
jgi:hypothetical protein